MDIKLTDTQSDVYRFALVYLLYLLFSGGLSGLL